jgi:hypothetical protein
MAKSGRRMTPREILKSVPVVGDVAVREQQLA